MTEIDTSTEAVESVALDLEAVAHSVSLRRTAAACDALRAAALLRALRAALDRAEAERVGWLTTAAHLDEGRTYYRRLLVQCGNRIGRQARIADDGSEADETLVAKVPELVAALVAERNARLDRKHETQMQSGPEQDGF